ncbi:hypothetical protein MASR2M64_08970 [Candidatus Cloacimonadota bacterium]
MPKASMHMDTIIHGVRWNLGTTVLRRILSLLLLFALASWLTQSDFGIFRTYSLILAVITIIAVLGLDSNLITSKRYAKLNVFAFTQIGLITGIFLSLLLTLSSSWLAKLYQSTELGLIIRWMSLFVLVEVLRKLLHSIAQVRLMFKEIALAETWNVVFYCLMSFSVIYFYRHLWVYVLAYFLGNLVETIYLYVCLKPFPSLHLKRLFSLKWLKLSLKIMGMNRAFLTNVSIIRLINTYAGNAPILFLGTMVNPTLMGQYFFATQLIGVPVLMFTTAVGQVFYPVFAQNDRSNTIQNIKSYTRLTLSLGIPLLLMYYFGLSILVPILFKGKWDAALPLLLYLIPYFCSVMLNNPISGIPFICRKPSWELVWNIVTLGVCLLALLWGLRNGFGYAVLLFSFSSAFMNLVFYFMSLNLLGASLIPAIQSLISWGIGNVLLIMALIWVSSLPYPILYASLCFIVYLLSLYLFAKPVLRDVRRVFH